MKKTLLITFIALNIFSLVYLFNLDTISPSDILGKLSSLILAFSAAYFPGIVFISYCLDRKKPE